MGLPNPSRETKFSGANADIEIFIFPVQLTTYVQDWQLTVAKKMGTYFEMGMDGHRFVCFQIGTFGGYLYNNGLFV